MQHNARIPVAIRHTSRAAVADELASIEFPNGANRCPPIFTSPQVVIPIHIKVLVPAVADKTLGLAMQTLLPVGDGGAWILQRKERAQSLDCIEGGQEFTGREVYKVGVVGQH